MTLRNWTAALSAVVLAGGILAGCQKKEEANAAENAAVAADNAADTAEAAAADANAAAADASAMAGNAAADANAAVNAMAGNTTP